MQKGKEHKKTKKKQGNNKPRTRKNKQIVKQKSKGIAREGRNTKKHESKKQQRNKENIYITNKDQMKKYTQ